MSRHEMFDAPLLNDYRPNGAARWLELVARATVRTEVCSFFARQPDGCHVMTNREKGMSQGSRGKY